MSTSNAQRVVLATLLAAGFLIRIDARGADVDVSQVGTSRGICVVLGDDAGDVAAELAEKTELIVVIQSASMKDVESLRRRFDESNLLGDRVYIYEIRNGRLSLADNLASAVIVGSSKAPLPERTEQIRVLHPRGRLIVGDTVVAKEVPKGTGEWTHPYHGADNNPLAEDQLAKAPYLTKFLAPPHYGPMPEVTLSAGGRLFKAFGHLAFKEREWPMVGKLVAINAYSGTMLWQRDMEPGFMIHRNTMVATEDTLYLADHISCKLIDTATGDIREEILVPEGISDGPVWKWMTIRDGVLYALVGEKEKLHEVHKGTRGERGWPWQTVKATYGKEQDSWGFGRTLFAMDLKSRDVLWSHREKDPIDSRAMSMAGGRIFVYSHEKFLAAFDARSGNQVWRTDSASVLKAIGEHDPADNPRLGYSTSSYMKSTADALFFAGPQRRKLVAVSAKNGQLLWSFDDGNMQLIIRPDGLYAMGRMQTSKKFAPLTGEVLADLQCHRGNCTRATGTADSIFARGYRHTGTLRFDVEKNEPHRLPSMRPACQDGVLAANGQLYWGPWMCDCNHSLVGVISLASAGDFPFDYQATNEDCLTTFDNPPLEAVLKSDDKDWPTLRADNQRSSATPVDIPSKVDVRWRYQPQKNVMATPSIAVGRLSFYAGSDGIVRALDSRTGKVRWSARTGGRIYYPPSFEDGRLLVGSADGCVHAYDAASGMALWKFRAAPVDRVIPVYGRLSSTWPVASGVIIDKGTAYAAAGIANHDGTYVYALDARTGRLRWQNTTSHSLTEDGEITGVSVQGHLLLNGDRLYMAGGNVVSPAIYSAEDGKCLNELKADRGESLDKHWQMQRSSRGSELFLNGDQVITGGRMLYAEKQDGIQSRYNGNYVLQAARDGLVIRGNNQQIQRVDPSQVADGKPKVIWQRNWFSTVDAIVVAKNAIVIAGRIPDTARQNRVVPAILALDIDDGSVLWSHRLPQRVVRWGLAVNREGSILVSLGNGEVVSLAAAE